MCSILNKVLLHLRQLGLNVYDSRRRNRFKCMLGFLYVYARLPSWVFLKYLPVIFVGHVLLNLNLFLIIFFSDVSSSSRQPTYTWLNCLNQVYRIKCACILFKVTTQARFNSKRLENCGKFKLLEQNSGFLLHLNHANMKPESANLNTFFSQT